MRSVAVSSAALLLASALAGVSAQSAPTANLKACVPNGQFNANFDYFPEKVQAKDATLFSVTYNKNVKTVKNLSTNNTYLLYQCGTPAPSAPTGDNTTFVIPVPVSKVAATQTSNIPYLDVLGVRTSIAALGSFVDTVSPCIQQAIQQKTIAPLDSKNATNAARQLQGVNVAFGADPTDPIFSNTTIVQTSEVLDPTALARAEWVKFYSTFYNAEAQANSAYDALSSNYKCVAEKVASAGARRPLVIWASAIDPAFTKDKKPSWTVSPAGYKVNLTHAAGGRFLFPKNGTFASADDFKYLLSKADVVIDETYYGTNFSSVLKGYTITGDDADPAKSKYNFVKNGQLFRLDGTVNSADGRDWFEGAVAFPDLVVEDFAGVLHPKLLQTSDSSASLPANKWFRNLAADGKPTVINATSCRDPAAAFKNPAVTCGAVNINSAAVSVKAQGDDGGDYFDDGKYPAAGSDSGSKDSTKGNGAGALSVSLGTAAVAALFSTAFF